MLAIFTFQVAMASDTERENCVYNGKKLDPSTSKPTPLTTPKVPEIFTGKVSCFSVPEGRIQEEFWLVNGLRDGISLTFGMRGGVEESVSYKKGKRHGHYAHYHHATKKLQDEGEHVDDQRVGVQKSYDSDKGFLNRAYWALADGGMDTDIQFNEKGQPIQLTCGKFSVVSQDDRWCGRSGKGQVEIFDETGKLMRVEQYSDGKLDGQVIEYGPEETVKVTKYAKGESKGTVETKKGKVTYARIDENQQSSERTYFPNTKKISAERVWQGSRLKSEKLYYENGKLKYEYTSVTPTESLVKHYYDNGVLYQEGNYESRFTYWGSHLVPKGKVRNFNEEGELIEENNFVNGVEEGEQKAFFKKKLLRREGYSKGELQWIEYYDDQERLVKKSEYNSDGSLKKETVNAKPAKV